MTSAPPVHPAAYAWLKPTLEKLRELLDLPANWDSYGARPIAPPHVFAALRLLLSVMGEDTPPPAVVPTVRGGVQLEWHARGIDLEIETLSPETFHISFEDDSVSGDEWETEACGDLTRLVDLISRLS